MGALKGVGTMPERTGMGVAFSAYLFIFRGF